MSHRLGRLVARIVLQAGMVVTLSLTEWQLHRVKARRRRATRADGSGTSA